MGVSHKYWQCHSWVAVSQTLKFLPLALVRNDIVYSPPARRQCHSLLEQEEEISMSARLPPRNGPFLTRARGRNFNVCETATQEWHCQYLCEMPKIGIKKEQWKIDMSEMSLSTWQWHFRRVDFSLLFFYVKGINISFLALFSGGFT